MLYLHTFFITVLINPTGQTITFHKEQKIPAKLYGTFI